MKRNDDPSGSIGTIKELVEDIDFTMLTTQDDAGNLVSGR